MNTPLRTAKRPQRTETIALTVEPRLRDAIVRAADAKNISVSSWLRWATIAILLRDAVFTENEVIDIVLGGTP